MHGAAYRYTNESRDCFWMAVRPDEGPPPSLKTHSVSDLEPKSNLSRSAQSDVRPARRVSSRTPALYSSTVKSITQVIAGAEETPQPDDDLTPDQISALAQIEAAYEHGGVFLLTGHAGSGKSGVDALSSHSSLWRLLGAHDVMPTGDDLVAALRRLGCRLIIHGHEHIPRLTTINSVSI